MLNRNESIVPLTREHYEKVFGYAPATTVRGYSLLRDGEVVAAMGMRRYENTWAFFIEGDWRRENKISHAVFMTHVIKRYALPLMEASKTPIVAQASTTIEGSEKLLRFMGFSERGEIWQWTSRQH